MEESGSSSTRGRQERPLIVAGGGIGGLTAALALARKGRTVRVFEQAAEIKPVGAGLQLGPNAFRIFDALDLSAAIRSRATFPDALVIKDALTGEEITNLPVAGSVQRRFGYPYAMMHRADLHGVLLEACRQRDGIQLLTGSRIASFEDDGQCVRVRTSAGVEHHAPALIGADGLWSIIRQTIVGDEIGRAHV